jgi:hypothetical protein
MLGLIGTGVYGGTNPIALTSLRLGQATTQEVQSLPGPAGAIQKMTLWGANGVAVLTHDSLVLAQLELAEIDSNDDRIPDAWAIEYGFDPLAFISDEDTDGDGATNVQEYRFGTNPIQASSKPEVQILKLPGDGVRLVFSSRKGQNYEVQRSPDLTTSWSTVSLTHSNGGYLTVDDLGAGDTGYYRIVATR